MIKLPKTGWWSTTKVPKRDQPGVQELYFGYDGSKVTGIRICDMGTIRIRREARIFENECKNFRGLHHKKAGPLSYYQWIRLFNIELVNRNEKRQLVKGKFI